MKRRVQLIVASAIMVLWAPALAGGFLHDDYAHIVEGTDYATYAGRLGHVAYYGLVGEMPALHRLIVTGLHILNALVLLEIVLLVTGSALQGFVAAIVFGTSYLTTEAVLFGEHTAVWMATVLLSVLLVLAWSRGRASWSWVTVSISAMAFLAAAFHEGIIVLPMMLGPYSTIVAPKGHCRRLMAVTAVLTGAAICGSILVQSCIRSALTGHHPLHLPLRLSEATMWSGVLWKVLTSMVFFILTPWYQVARLGGANALVGLVCAIIVIAGISCIVLRLRVRPADPRVLGWPFGSALICLLPAAPLGADTNMPTMGGRYLYCAWGLFVVAMAVFISGRIRPQDMRLSRAYLIVYITLSVLLVGLAQWRFLQRSGVDEQIIALVRRPYPYVSSEALPGLPLDVVLVGALSLRPSVMPTPDPAYLNGFDHRGMSDMFKLHGMDVTIRQSDSFPDTRRPGQLAIDLKRLKLLD